MLPSSCLRLSLALLLACCGTTWRAAAQEIVDEQDAQLWLQVNAQVPLTRTWMLVVEGQPRWNENLTHYDQVVLRSGVSRRLTPRLQAGAAYAIVPRRTIVGSIVEHQAYQQVLVTLPRLGTWSPQLRIREDQRFLAQWGDAAHRVREQLRFARPLPRVPGWTLVLNEEAFYNLDRTVRGPAPGWDQLRVYGGLQHALSRDLAVELGYMWQEVFRLGTRPHRRNHNAMIQLQYRPRRGTAPASSVAMPLSVAPAPAEASSTTHDERG